MAGMDLPVSIIRRQIASAVNLIVQQARLKDGSRKVVQITELQGMEGEQVTLQDIFVYQTPDFKGGGPSHAGGGTLNPTGLPAQLYGPPGRSRLQAERPHLRRGPDVSISPMTLDIEFGPGYGNTDQGYFL